jgi:hypothetical protein
MGDEAPVDDCPGDCRDCLWLPRVMLRGMSWLTDEQLRQFADEGYVVVRNVVSETLLAAADAEIDGLIAETPPAEGGGGPGQITWFPLRERLPRCDDVLRRSPALAVARELVSPNTIDHADLDGSRYNHTQIAITVPPWSHIPGGPHIDGWEPGASFTMLAGVLLTDQRGTQSGNLWVWPGSHLDHARLFRERGTTILERSGVNGHATLLDPPLALRPGIPIRGDRGDLVLAHFLTGHNKGGNTAGHVRRTIYYRLNVPGHVQRSQQTLTDPWLEYPRMRAVLGQ